MISARSMAGVMLLVVGACDPETFAPDRAPGLTTTTAFLSGRQIVAISERPGHPGQVAIVTGPTVRLTAHLGDHALTVGYRSPPVAGARGGRLVFTGFEIRSPLDVDPDLSLVIWDPDEDDAAYHPLTENPDALAIREDGSIHLVDVHGFLSPYTIVYQEWQATGPVTRDSLLVDRLVGPIVLSPRDASIAFRVRDSLGVEVHIDGPGVESPIEVARTPGYAELAFSPTGDSLAVADGDTLLVVDLRTLDREEIPIAPVADLVWSSNGIAARRSGSPAEGWRLTPDGGAWTTRPLPLPPDIVALVGNPEGITTWLTARLVAHAMVIEHPDRRTPREVALVGFHGPRAAVWDPTGERLAVLHSDDSLSVWVPGTGSVARSRLGGPGGVLGWSSSGLLVYRRGVIDVFDPGSPESLLGSIQCTDCPSPQGPTARFDPIRGVFLIGGDRGLGADHHELRAVSTQGEIELLATAGRPVLDAMPLPSSPGAYLVLLGRSGDTRSFAVRIAGRTVELGQVGYEHEQLGHLTDGGRVVLMGSGGITAVDLDPLLSP